MNKHTSGEEGCGPLRLDFDKLAADILDGKMAKAPKAADRPRLRTVDHALSHLREETGLDDRQIAKVMMTASVVFAGMVKHSTTWNAIGCANWLGLCGEQLWRDAAVGASDPEDEPSLTEVASRWWAVWTLDSQIGAGRIRAVEEFDVPQTRQQVRVKLGAESDRPRGALEPITEERAEALRHLVEQQDAQAATEPAVPHEPDGRFWAVWKPDGTLHALKEFTEPRLGGEVLAQLAGDGEIDRCELEPVTESRAAELRDLVQDARR